MVKKVNGSGMKPSDILQAFIFFSVFRLFFFNSKRCLTTIDIYQLDGGSRNLRQVTFLQKMSTKISVISLCTSYDIRKTE